MGQLFDIQYELDGQIPQNSRGTFVVGRLIANLIVMCPNKDCYQEQRVGAIVLGYRHYDSKYNMESLHDFSPEDPLDVMRHSKEGEKPPFQRICSNCGTFFGVTDETLQEMESAIQLGALPFHDAKVRELGRLTDEDYRKKERLGTLGRLGA